MFTKIKSVKVQEVTLVGPAHLIGMIRYTNLNDTKPQNTGNLPRARPLFKHFSNHPTINEIVHIIEGPKDNNHEDGHSEPYYFPPVNIYGWNANNNAQPNTLTQEDIENNSKTGSDPHFKEIKNIKPLLPYGGDIMIEGRYGNSIRFGSTNTQKSPPNNWSNEGIPGNPITIIRNGQSGSTEGFSDEFSSILEDINEDDSSIYLCSDQQITNFKKAGVSPDEHPASYKHMIHD